MFVFNHLKGLSQEVFDFYFFHESVFSRTLALPIISFENNARYSAYSSQKVVRDKLLTGANVHCWLFYRRCCWTSNYVTFSCEYLHEFSSKFEMELRWKLIHEKSWSQKSFVIVPFYIASYYNSIFKLFRAQRFDGQHLCNSPLWKFRNHPW